MACLSLIEKVVVGAISMVISPRLSLALESVTPKKVTAGLVIADVLVLQAISRIDAMAFVAGLEYTYPAIRIRYPVCISISLPLFFSSSVVCQRSNDATDHASNCHAV
jgi:hypothetical protein